MKKLIILSYYALVLAGTVNANSNIIHLHQDPNFSSGPNATLSPDPTKALHQILSILSDEKRNHEDIGHQPLEDLLARGANPLWIGENGLAAIHMAAKIGLVSSFPLIHCIKNQGNGLDHPDNNGMSALCHAAANGHTLFMEILIRHGEADPNFKLPKTGLTPLHLATMNSQENAVWNLVKQYGVQIRLDHSGKVPTDYASFELKRKLRDRQIRNKFRK